VLVDGRHLDPEQLGQRLLRQPDGLVLEEHVHLHRPVRRGVEKKLGVLEGGGEEGGGGFVEAVGFAAVEFGADGVEIHEPALEQRPRHRLQGRVHPPVQLDLVVQRPKHRRDGFLLGGGGWRSKSRALRK
jgi:hypothetical protein